MVDNDNELTKDILSRERHLRTRTSVLQSNGKVCIIILNSDAVLNLSLSNLNIKRKKFLSI